MFPTSYLTVTRNQIPFLETVNLLFFFFTMLNIGLPEVSEDHGGSRSLAEAQNIERSIKEEMLIIPNPLLGENPLF